MTGQTILILDSERQCKHCRDTGLMTEENGHGGFASARCIYCNCYDAKRANVVPEAMSRAEFYKL